MNSANQNEDEDHPATTPRRVLMITRHLPVPFDRRVWQQARELATRGYLVSVICPTGHGQSRRHETVTGISIYRYPAGASALFWEFALACWVLLRGGFDVIHACDPLDSIFLIGGFFKFMFDKKFLFDHRHGAPEWFEATFKRRGFMYHITLWGERMTFNMADISIAANESYRKIAIERGHMRGENVFIVRSPLSLDRLRILPPVPAWRKGRQYMVAYVGAMGRQEGVQHLIEAARYIVYDLKRANIHFVLAGEGTERRHLVALAAEKKLGDFITFADQASDQTVLDILNTADVCVNPNEVNVMSDKATIHKIVEYMALGKPIVQFDLTEGRFTAADASLYAQANEPIDFAAKIVELIDDPQKRAAMGAFGRARVERELAWIYEAPKLLAAYDALFATSAGF